MDLREINLVIMRLSADLAIEEAVVARLDAIGARLARGEPEDARDRRLRSSRPWRRPVQEALL